MHLYCRGQLSRASYLARNTDRRHGSLALCASAACPFDANTFDAFGSGLLDNLEQPKLVSQPRTTFQRITPKPRRHFMSYNNNLFLTADHRG